MTSQFASVDDALMFLQENIHVSLAPASFPKAADFLVQQNDPRLYPAFVDGLQRGGEYIRALSAKALGLLGDTAAIPHLIKAVQNDPGVYVRCDAILALADLYSDHHCVRPDKYSYVLPGSY